MSLNIPWESAVTEAMRERDEARSALKSAEAETSALISAHFGELTALQEEVAKLKEQLATSRALAMGEARAWCAARASEHRASADSLHADGKEMMALTQAGAWAAMAGAVEHLQSLAPLPPGLVVMHDEPKIDSPLKGAGIGEQMSMLKTVARGGG